MTPDPLIAPPDDHAITRAAEAIRRGELVGMPTETVYGLACNALDDHAVARVFHAKARPSFDPLIVHAASAAETRLYADRWPDIADRLADALWPGPLTLVLPKRRTGARTIGDLVTSGLPTVALRVPAHPVARRLIEAAGVPLAAPSANRFGRISPTRPEHVVDELAGRVAIVLDGGACATGVESTVVSLVTPEQPVLLRPGGVTLEAISELLGRSPQLAEGRPSTDAEATIGQASPGMLQRHYAPATPLQLVDSLNGVSPATDDLRPGERIAWLGFTRVPEDWRSHPGEVLSPRGDPVEAAANLFAALRRLDASGVSRIVAERAPDRGLGRSINDRLSRAAHRDPAAG